jgi:hypothetical protein
MVLSKASVKTSTGQSRISDEHCVISIVWFIVLWAAPKSVAIPISSLHWPMGTLVSIFKISLFSRDHFFPHVLIDFERVCFVSLQRFEKAVNLSFQNQLTNTRGKNLSQENKEFFKRLRHSLCDLAHTKTCMSFWLDMCEQSLRSHMTFSHMRNRTLQFYPSRHFVWITGHD